MIGTELFESELLADLLVAAMVAGGLLFLVLAVVASLVAARDEPWDRTLDRLRSWPDGPGPPTRAQRAEMEHRAHERRVWRAAFVRNSPLLQRVKRWTNSETVDVSQPEPVVLEDKNIIREIESADDALARLKSGLETSP